MNKQFWIWEPNAGEAMEDGQAYDGIDAEGAVEQWAEDDDSSSAEYRIVGGTLATVKVRLPDKSVVTMVVEGEAIPIYSARLAP